MSIQAITLTKLHYIMHNQARASVPKSAIAEFLADFWSEQSLSWYPLGFLVVENRL